MASVPDIVNDGFGAWLIARRVAEIYTSRANNLPDNDSPLGSLRLLLEDEKKYRASEPFARDQKYWVEGLAEMPEPVSLADKPPVKSAAFYARLGIFSPPVRICCGWLRPAPGQLCLRSLLQR